MTLRFYTFSYNPHQDHWNHWPSVLFLLFNLEPLSLFPLTPPNWLIQTTHVFKFWTVTIHSISFFNILQCPSRSRSWAIIQKVEGCTSAISDGHTSAFPGPGDQGHISQQLPWMPLHPGSEWWWLTSAASVLKGHLIPASLSEQGTVEPSRQVLTHNNKGTAMSQSHIHKISPKD